MRKERLGRTQGEVCRTFLLYAQIVRPRELWPVARRSLCWSGGSHGQGSTNGASPPTARGWAAAGRHQRRTEGASRGWGEVVSLWGKAAAPPVQLVCTRGATCTLHNDQISKMIYEAHAPESLIPLRGYAARSVPCRHAHTGAPAPAR